MKTIAKILFVVVFSGFVFSCSRSDGMTEDIPDAVLKSTKTQMVTLPFKADFLGNYLDVPFANPECGECPVDEEGIPTGPECWGIIFNDGEGTATHLGKFTHHFEFCVELFSGIYPGPTDHIDAWFVAANGDTLFVYVSGQVMPGRLDHHPEDVNSYFTDEWKIVGGTGRFEGASGSGWTDDYNRDAYPANSFHHWTGTITMLKGKR